MYCLNHKIECKLHSTNSGTFCFCPVCLSVLVCQKTLTFAITIRDSLFGMYTCSQIIKPFQMTQN